MKNAAREEIDRKWLNFFEKFDPPSDAFEEKCPDKEATACFLLAMAGYRAGKRDEAIQLLNRCHEQHAGTDAGFRAWLKLIDLELLKEGKPPIAQIRMEYDQIIENCPNRCLQEEAFFKQIIACHLYGENAWALKLLHLFLEDGWAQSLRDEALALLSDFRRQGACPRTAITH